MGVYQFLSLCGFPTLFLGAIGVFYSIMKQTRLQNKATQLGVQALLRAQMINDYNKWIMKKYAPIYARENFENCWKQYHSLGANGVMDDIREKFMDLPTEPPKEE